MKKNRKKNVKLLTLILLLLIGIGFAALAANLKIDGTVNIDSASWDVHFENVQVTQGSVTANPAPTSDDTTTTEMTYTVNFTKPGDFYEFTVDIANDGTIDAMINLFSNTTYEQDGTTPKNLPDYLRSTMIYNDGSTIRQNQELLHGTSEKIKVRIEYRTDIDPSDLPENPDTVVFKLNEDYKQKDDTSIPVRFDADFVDDSWNDIAIAYNNGKTANLEEAMANGTTREVLLDLDNDGTPETTKHLRIANLSAPQECSQPDFSRSACGLVIEFADLITTHRMNPDGSSQDGKGNYGGWEHSEMRNYVNSVIYNALPAELKARIIDTPVISGHGSQQSTNFYTNDKIYLLAAHEIWEDVDGDPTNGIDYTDTAYNNTRQLDYYHDKGVTSDTSTQAPVMKESNGYYNQWWTRSAELTYNNAFTGAYQSGWSTAAYSYRADAVSPAFRIG